MGPGDSPEGNGKSHRGFFQVGIEALTLRVGQMVHYRVMSMYGKWFLLL